MEGLVENEQLPGISPPPVATSVSDGTNGNPPLYSPPEYLLTPYTSVPPVNHSQVVVRNMQYSEPDPPGLSRSIVTSLVLSSIAMMFVVPIFCAVPAVVYATLFLHLVPRYDSTLADGIMFLTNPLLCNML